MITRLRVRGFKNLVDVDVRFGPFTCIAGVNGVGKSNLFDAILLMGRLADDSLLEAVTRVRGETRSLDAGRIFTQAPSSLPRDLALEVEMIVPAEGRDDLGQVARATTTGLRYAVTLRLHPDEGSPPRIQLVSEQLDYLKRGDARDNFPFARPHRDWLSSVLAGTRRSPFISTESTDSETLIKIHEDSGHQGRSRTLRADHLSRTVLSTVNTSEHPTALVARRELQSWKLLQLEPSRLRAPDEFAASARLSPDGAHLPATVYRLIREGDEASVRARLANRLAELVESIAEVRVDVDHKRELLTLMATGRDRMEHRARDLSDGTLRFLALAVLEIDATWTGTICMEEPENGIHPTRVPAMLKLLQDIAVSLNDPVDGSNAMRQVIINTHSPEVAALVPPDALLFASARSRGSGGPSELVLLPVRGTWRSPSEHPSGAVSSGTVLEMLNATQAALREARERQEEVLGSHPDFEQLIMPFAGSPRG